MRRVVEVLSLVIVIESTAIVAVAESNFESDWLGVAVRLWVMVRVCNMEMETVVFPVAVCVK